ncbi:MAG: glycoside hydrolase family 3 N-terminal domain-containing protein [Bacteriovoracaceae bacterium]
MKHILFLLVLPVTFSISQQQSISFKVDALLTKMTLEEKIGQMTLVDYSAIKQHPDDIIKYSLGSILWGGDSEVKDITPKGWAEVYDSLQTLSQKTRLKIPIIFGIDGVHGHHNVDGAVIFPHNIGLGATRNPALVEQVGVVTAQEVRGTGIQWDFSPCVAVARDERWGRTYECFGEEPELVAQLSAAYINGIQGKSLSDKAALLACAKHFVADGGTTTGSDQGNTEIDEATLRAIHLPGYVKAINADAKSIMVSARSWNGISITGHKYLLTDVLKNELGFKGFLVSDWAAIDRLSPKYEYAIEQSINAGIDMVMNPNGQGNSNNYIDFVTKLKKLVQENRVSVRRIDDAVRRILTVKFDMNLSKNLFVDKELLSQVGSKEHRAVAKDAVRQSLVLLKNENSILPISKKLRKIQIAGKGADNIGMQCGGWTISWQGKDGNVISGGTTILQAIKNTVSQETEVTYSADGSGGDSNGVAIIVVGESPYAEMFGDRADLSLSGEDAATVERVKAKGIPVVVVLLSGRPMIINATFEKSNAFIAAWLPGTEGQGVADVLFGDYVPKGKLPHSWPKEMKQIPINIGDKEYDPLFPFGFGLTYNIVNIMK